MKKSLRVGARGLAKAKQSTIRALSIRQPWAELILCGRKPFELRTWRTKHRGLLAIHAANRVEAGIAWKLGLNPKKLRAGAFVGVAVLSDVRPYSWKDARLLKKRRAGFGWIPHHFAWVLKQPRRIPPFKAKGQLGLFDVPKEVNRRIRKLISLGEGIQRG